MEEQDMKEDLEPGTARDVPDVEDDDAPAAPAPFLPAKVTSLRPSGINVDRFPDGGAQIELLISPFEVISFALPPEAVTAVIAELTPSGIEIARSIPQVPVPTGRG